jgi:hypothetical protein
MRLSIRGCLFVLISGVCFAWAAENQSKYVEVKKPFANVYEYLDPKSKIIQQAKRGEHFELIYEGTSWYQVKIRKEAGWLEKRAGKIVDSPQYVVSSINSTAFLIFFVVMMGALAAFSFVILKNRSLEQKSLEEI